MARALAEVGRQTVAHLARSKWRGSGLSDGAAKKLGMVGLSAAQVTHRSPRFHSAGSLFIPYYNLDGERTKFYRIRYLERLPGMAGQLAKPQKYDQLPVMQEVYYPPLMARTWRDIAQDAGVEVAITEGELKAACATYATKGDVPTMALGGVYSFMSSKRGVDLLPSMKEFDWTGRVTYIIYDNDLSDNPDVMRAQRLLAERLLQEGAKIRFVSIPKGPAKGIDDFIVAHGPEAFQGLLEKAQGFGEGDALWHLNEEVVFIRTTDVVVERKTNLIMQPDKFARHVYGNRHYFQQVIVGSGKTAREVLQKEQLAPKWIEWEARAEMDRITYQPGLPKVTCSRCPAKDGHAHDRSWNGWNGWGVAPKKGDVTPWHDLMDFLFFKDHKTRKFFERWCAYPIQHPGAKLYTACVLWSRVKRLGKSMVGLALSKIYGENSAFVSSRQLKSEFNIWAKNKQLVVGEEITANDNKMDADYLKHIITHPQITIREMYIPPYDIPNHTNFLFLSNHPDAMFLEDGDKRYLIHGVPRNSPAPREFYEKADKWLHGDGPAHLMDYLLRLPMGSFNPREHAPDTMSKFQMIVAGKSDVALWVQKLQEDPVSALRPLGERVAQECDLFTAEQILRAFDPEGRWLGRGVAGSLGRALQSAGFRQVNGGELMGLGNGKTGRPYAVRNQVRWDQSTRREARDHYASFFGPASAGEVK